jgi:hypothetical protein
MTRISSGSSILIPEELNSADGDEYLLEHMKHMNKLLFLILLLFANIFSQTYKTIHVFVPLCDNEHQGIVPVSKKLGNGEDLINNLYWGAGYGVKSYLKTTSWKLIYDTVNINSEILERCVFKKGNTYLCADAYKGIEIKNAITAFVKSIAGDLNDSLSIKGNKIGIYGNANLLVYVGHNGLMDFPLDYDVQQRINSRKRDVMVLCCMSKQYFYDIVKKLDGNPLLLTTNLMAPEAYVLASAINDWDSNKSHAEIIENAASAYNKYQKCGLNSAKRLFFTEE